MSLASHLKAKLLDDIINSSFHGIPKIFKSTSWPLRIFWIVCFSSAFAFCTYFVTTAFINFFNWSVITNINEYHET